MRVAIVVPRYGRDVGGGAETLAREYATRLARRMDVTVLTTCAHDYRIWRDHYPPGAHVEDGVRVLRFAVPVPRNGELFDALSIRVLGGGRPDPTLERQWMDAQGPNAPGLLDHLEREGRGYDAVLFIPYLYATTVRGLPIVRERAVLIPALHDEPPLRLRIFDDVVRSAKALVFSTIEEQGLAHRRFGVEPAPTQIVGAGIDPPPHGDPELFRARFGVDAPYVLCLGRIDASKGSDALVDAHRAYRARRPAGLDLVMLGPSVMSLPDEPWLHAPGYVTNQEKHDAIAGAVALVCPSPFESLSLVLLEAWSHSIPSIVTAASPVLVGQSRRAAAGVWYRDKAEYAACLDLVSSRPALARALGRSGWRFTRTLGWSAVIDRLERTVRLAAAGDPGADGAPMVAETAARIVGPVQVACDASSAESVARILTVAGPRSQLYVLTDGRGPVPHGAVKVAVDRDGLAGRLSGIDVVVCGPGDGELTRVARQAGAIVTDGEAHHVERAVRAAAAQRG